MSWVRGIALAAVIAAAPLAASAATPRLTFSVPGHVTSSDVDGVPTGLDFMLTGYVDLTTFPTGEPITSIPSSGAFSFTPDFDPFGEFHLQMPNRPAPDFGTWLSAPTLTFFDGKLTRIDYEEFADSEAGATLLHDSLDVSYDAVRDPDTGDIIDFPEYFATLDYAHSTFEGVPLSGAPEPMAWVLMLGGFSLVGSALRRRAVLAV